MSNTHLFRRLANALSAFKNAFENDPFLDPFRESTIQSLICIVANLKSSNLSTVSLLSVRGQLCEIINAIAKEEENLKDP